MSRTHGGRGFKCALAVASFALQLAVAQAASPVFISEFLAVNASNLKDDDGDLSGWIEVANQSRATVNLVGWFLTDTPTNLTKWRFPKVMVLSDKYLLVFASGKDRRTDPLHLHTNFELNRQGGYLALVDSSTNVVSEFKDFPEQQQDNSYGRVLGEPAVAGRFFRPTPGKMNPTHGPGFTPAVEFSKASGTFIGSVPIDLTCPSSNAVIHYTLDGSLPHARSPIYSRSVTLSKSAHVRARAYAEGLLPGPARSETYLLLHPSLQTFTSNLPVLVMDTLGEDPSRVAGDALAYLSLFEPMDGRTSLTNAPSFAGRAGCHIRGSSTLDMPKSSFVMNLVDEWNQEQSHGLLGLPPDSDWVLYGPNAYEPVMIHNPFVHQLSRDLGRYSPRTRFLEVFFVGKSGPISTRQYQGIYVLEEKIKIGKHRVDIDRLGPADVKLPEITGGYLFKIDRLGPGESGLWTGLTSIVYVDPKERAIELPQRAAQKQYVANYFAEFERVLRSANWKDPSVGYPAYIDVDSWIDYHILEVLSGNVDAFHFSTYFYKPRNGKIAFGPHWDYDRALGSTDGRDDDPRRWNTGRFFAGAWWARLFRDPDFWQHWVDRWQEVRQAQFSNQHLNNLIDQLAGELREAQPREAARWAVEPRGGTYQTEVDYMKEWLSNRVDFIDGQLVSRPGLPKLADSVTPGTALTFAVPANAALYYTLDGSDPRGPQGIISSNATLYSGPLRLTTDARVIARARDLQKLQSGGPRTSTPWSGPVSAAYKVRAP